MPSTPHRHGGDADGGLDGAGDADDGGGGLVAGGGWGGDGGIISGIFGNNKLVIELAINVAINAGIMMSLWS